MSISPVALTVVVGPCVVVEVEVDAVVTGVDVAVVAVVVVVVDGVPTIRY